MGESLATWTLLQDIRGERDWLHSLAFLEVRPRLVNEIARFLSCPEDRAREVIYDIVWEELAELPDGNTCLLTEKGLACIQRIRQEDEASWTEAWI